VLERYATSHSVAVWDSGATLRFCGLEPLFHFKRKYKIVLGLKKTRVFLTFSSNPKKFRFSPPSFILMQKDVYLQNAKSIFSHHLLSAVLWNFFTFAVNLPLLCRVCSVILLFFCLTISNFVALSLFRSSFLCYHWFQTPFCSFCFCL